MKTIGPKPKIFATPNMCVQVCGPEEVEVPYTKCRDEPRELVCEKVERPSCGQ